MTMDDESFEDVIATISVGSFGLKIVSIRQVNPREKMIGRLMGSLDGLSDEDLSDLIRISNSLQGEMVANRSESSNIVNDRFLRSMYRTMVSHHARSTKPMQKESFEHALRKVCLDCGMSAVLANAATFPGADIIINGQRFSLKTEGAASISPHSITISKLFEAGWLKDCHSLSDVHSEFSRRIALHLSHYDRMLILRNFTGPESVRYELIEVPKILLTNMVSLGLASFGPRTARGGTSAKVHHNGSEAFNLRLDGSVDKVTLNGIKISDCIFHADWTVPRFE